MGEVYLAEDTDSTASRRSKFSRARIQPQDAERSAVSRLKPKRVSALNHPNILIDSRNRRKRRSPFYRQRICWRRNVARVIAETKICRLPKFSTSAHSNRQRFDRRAHAHNSSPRHQAGKSWWFVQTDSWKFSISVMAKLTEYKRKLIGSEDRDRDKPSGTTPGMIFGRSNYMSPEQARGGKIDARIWYFQFGFGDLRNDRGQKSRLRAKSDVVNSRQFNQRRTVSLARFLPNAPRQIAAHRFKKLSKNADERYQTMKDLLNDLKDVRQESEFQSKLSARIHPLQEEAKTQIVNPATSDQSPSETSGVESVTGENKNYKLAQSF